MKIFIAVDAKDFNDSTDTTPWQEVQTRDLGWCVSWSDYPTALRQAIGCPGEELRRRGLASRRWVLDSYSWDKSAKRLVRFYDEVRALPLHPVP